jgi:tetraacyldisaccharide 4'-kinase
MVSALQRAWLRRGVLAWLLLPLSLLFGLLVAIRQSAYKLGWARSERMPVPVVVVGNVVAGGSGKTPVVMAIVRHLRARGVLAGVISRGYGRRTADCRPVRAGDAPADTGDEPLLIATETGVPVYVAARRADAARALLAAHPSTQVIVCDDGLQHHGLARDVEICVFDERAVGNGWLMPSGPLREPWPRPADLVVRPSTRAELGGFEVRRELADFATRADGGRAALAQFRGQAITGIAGIATPESFFTMLRERGLRLERTIGLPDHADITADVLPRDGTLLCTQKDAAKLWRLRPGAWAVPLVVEFPPAFWEAFDRLLDAKLSSPHGPETA